VQSLLVVFVVFLVVAPCVCVWPLLLHAYHVLRAACFARSALIELCSGSILDCSFLAPFCSFRTDFAILSLV
jgi:hypothetical protein